mmetsp:Transcript_855/g.1103  ORF Transcript_855/g.1103 Transcript_855/m.1103 type:complete len:80 (+) Transcript_855:1312-1551(+)
MQCNTLYANNFGRRRNNDAFATKLQIKSLPEKTWSTVVKCDTWKICFESAAVAARSFIPGNKFFLIGLEWPRRRRVRIR